LKLANILCGSDARPRIHVWPTPAGASFAFHPTGPRQSRMSIGEAVEAALDTVDHKAAVIIFEGVG
jgi:hypothetical protein